MWYKVFFVPFVLPGFSGLTLGPFIFIRSDRKGDIGLIAHEKVHVSQWYKRKFTHGFRYLFSREYRFQCEAEAYAWSVFFKGATEQWLAYYAHILATKYFLKVTEGEAKDAIKRYLYETNFFKEGGVA